MTAQTHPWTLICNKCDAPAIHMKRIPLPSDAISPVSVEHIDGRAAHPFDAFACDSCNMPLRNFGPGGFAWMTNPANWRRREE